MSLDRILLCCDDGATYECDGIAGPGLSWGIVLEEFRDALLLVAARPRAKGEPRGQPRPLVDPQSLIQEHRLPISKLVFSGSNKRSWPRQGEFSEYRITWQRGKAFPRGLLGNNHGRQAKPGTTGTLYCLTNAHKENLFPGQAR